MKQLLVRVVDQGLRLSVLQSRQAGIKLWGQLPALDNWLLANNDPVFVVALSTTCWAVITRSNQDDVVECSTRLPLHHVIFIQVDQFAFPNVIDNERILPTPHP